VAQVDEVQFIQVTTEKIFVFAFNNKFTNNTDEFKALSSHECFVNGEKITIVDHFENNVLVVGSKGSVLSVEIKDGRVLLVKRIELKQISAVTLSKHHIAIAKWQDPYIFIHDRSTLSQIYKISIPQPGVFSLRFQNLNNEDYLFCGTFEGSLATYKYSYMVTNPFEHNFQILEENHFTYGVTPVHVQEFFYQNKPFVFIGCDSPSVLYLNNNKKIVSTHILRENIQELHCLRFHVKEYALAFIENTVQIVSLETDDKVLVKTLPFARKEYINFVKHVAEYNSFVLGLNTQNVQFTEGSMSVALYDGNSYLPINQQVTLDDAEIQCLDIFQVGNAKILFVGGGRFSTKKGFAFFYKVTPEGIVKIQEIFYEKYVRDVDMLLDTYIVVALASTIKIIKMKEDEPGNHVLSGNNIAFEEILSKTIDTARMRINCFEHFVLSVDEIKGVNLFLYNTDDNKLVKVGASMRSAMDNEIGYILESDTLLLSCIGKVKMLKRNRHADTESERLTFNIRACINLNDTITALKKESITLFENYNLQNGTSNTIIPSQPLDYFVYGTEKGNVGVIMMIPETTFQFLKNLQDIILSEITNSNAFGSNYVLWRSHLDPQTNERNESAGFIDGDVLKRFLTFSQIRMQNVLDKMSHKTKPSLTDIVHLIDKFNKFI
jgi:hypothetical protein